MQLPLAWGMGLPGRHEGNLGGPQGGTREAGKDHLDSLWTAWEAPGRHHQGGRKGPLHSLGGTREAPGMQERIYWTAGRHQGGRKWTAWEAPGRHLDSLRGTREALGQPGRHQGGRKGPIGQPGRHQGGTREAGKD